MKAKKFEKSEQGGSTECHFMYCASAVQGFRSIMQVFEIIIIYILRFILRALSIVVIYCFLEEKIFTYIFTKKYFNW